MENDGFPVFGGVREHLNVVFFQCSGMTGANKDMDLSTVPALIPLVNHSMCEGIRQLFEFDPVFHRTWQYLDHEYQCTTNVCYKQAR